MPHGSRSPRNSLKTFQDLGLLMMQHHGAAHNLLVHRLLQEVVDPFLVSNTPHRWAVVARRRWGFTQSSSSATVSQGPLVLQAVAQGANKGWQTVVNHNLCCHERIFLQAVSAKSSARQKTTHIYIAAEHWVIVLAPFPGVEAEVMHASKVQNLNVQLLLSVQLVAQQGTGCITGDPKMVVHLPNHLAAKGNGDFKSWGVHLHCKPLTQNSIK